MRNSDEHELIQEPRSRTAIVKDWVAAHEGWFLSALMLFAWLQLLLNAFIAGHMFFFDYNPPLIAGIPKTDIVTLTFNGIVWVIVLAVSAKYYLEWRIE